MIECLQSEHKSFSPLWRNDRSIRLIFDETLFDVKMFSCSSFELFDEPEETFVFSQLLFDKRSIDVEQWFKSMPRQFSPMNFAHRAFVCFWWSNGPMMNIFFSLFNEEDCKATQSGSFSCRWSIKGEGQSDCCSRTSHWWKWSMEQGNVLHRLDLSTSNGEELSGKVNDLFLTCSFRWLNLISAKRERWAQAEDERESGTALVPSREVLSARLHFCRDCLLQRHASRDELLLISSKPFLARLLSSQRIFLGVLATTFILQSKAFFLPADHWSQRSHWPKPSSLFTFPPRFCVFELLFWESDISQRAVNRDIFHIEFDRWKSFIQRPKANRIVE